MADIDFLSLTYLQTGSPVQRQGYDVLQRSEIFADLAAFSPVLVGTLPLDLFVDGSDLDILCCAADLEQLAKVLHVKCGDRSGFRLSRLNVDSVETIVAGFSFEGFDVEIFGQRVPVSQQPGYRHMVIEWQVLQAQGTVFKEAVLALKKSGVKTEPAFARLLGLTGNPYQALLNYKPS